MRATFVKEFENELGNVISITVEGDKVGCTVMIEGPNSGSTSAITRKEAAILHRAMGDYLEVTSEPSGMTWKEAVSHAVQRFEVAAAIGTGATWNAKGCKAMATLIKKMAELLDDEVEHRKHGKEHPTAP